MHYPKVWTLNHRRQRAWIFPCWFQPSSLVTCPTLYTYLMPLWLRGPLSHFVAEIIRSGAMENSAWALRLLTGECSICSYQYNSLPSELPLLQTPTVTSLGKSPGRTCFIPLGRFAEASEVQMKINQGDFCRFAGIAKSNEGDYGLPWHISSVRLVSFAFSVEDGTMYPYTVRTRIYIYDINIVSYIMCIFPLYIYM